MNIIIGLLIIAIGAFCQSSSYVPINKIKSWSWESYWLVQGVFAWLIFPFLGALLAVPAGHGLFELYAAAPKASLLTAFFGVLWGVGGLTFGLSMRYLGVALGQSIALGTCAGLGTIMGPVLLNLFFPELGALSALTSSVIIGVVVTLVRIAIIGVAGGMKSASLSEDENKETVKDFNFPKGLAIALHTASSRIHGTELLRTIRTESYGHPTYSSAPWPDSCGTASSSDFRSAAASLRRAAQWTHWHSAS